MASILDSFKETYSDKLGFFKILVFAIPIYYFYTQYLISDAAFTKVLLYFHITIFFLFGFIVEVTNSVLNERDWVMPALNPLKLAFSAVKGLIAILPSTLICVFLGNYITKFINIVPWVDTAFKSIIWLVVAAIILTSFLMYVKTENILDAFNIKTIMAKSGDFIAGIIVFILKLLIINLPTFIFIGYVINVLLGFGPLMYFFLAYALLFNLVASGHYMAQLQYEILGYDKQNINTPK